LLANWDKPNRPQDHSQGSARYDIKAYRDWIQNWKSAHNFGSRNNSYPVYKLNEREQAYADRANAAAAREKFKLEVEMAEYVPRLAANTAIETGNNIVRRELRKAMEFELPPRLEMMRASEIRKVMIAKLNDIVSHLPKLLMGTNGSNGTRT